MAETQAEKPQTLAQFAAELAKTMRCNCDLDNWEPERSPYTGHSWVCRIHTAAVAGYKLPRIHTAAVAGYKLPRIHTAAVAGYKLPPPEPKAEPLKVEPKVGAGGAWTAFQDQRPPRGKFWFRAPEQPIPGGFVPEFVDDVRSVGMGFADNEDWPSFSHWDGYQRTVPKSLQWRSVIDGEPTELRFPGLDLLPCPFCARVPTVHYRGRWVTATVLNAEYFWPQCCGWISGRNWQQVDYLAQAWNRRPTAAWPQEDGA